MQVRFKTEHIKTKTVGAEDFELLEPFAAEIVYERLDPHLIVVPAGFVTDFESVPRFLGWAYALIKNKARKSATLHDYLLTQGYDRAWADRVFYAAMRAEGTGWLARELAYLGVSAYTVLAD